MGIESWGQLGAFGVVATILIVVLIQQGKQFEQVLNRQDALVNGLTGKLIEVIEANTAAMTSVEKAITDLPEFVRQTSARLDRGADRFDSHERRLDKLERET